MRLIAKPKGEWCLDECDFNPEELDYIPGLRLDVASQQVWGHIDAIAVACKRLGVDPPALPSIQGGKLYKDLYRFQNIGVALLARIIAQNGGALLADDVGLGKTRQSICLAKQLVGLAQRVLIVCPASVRETWRDEFKRLGIISYAILGQVSKKSQQAEWDTSRSKQWIVTSYNMAAKAHETAFEFESPALLILDEAHLIMGRGKQTRTGNKTFAQNIEDIAVMTQYRLAMTATPMWSRPRNYWRLLSILYGRTFGSKHDFDFAYCGGRINEYGGMANSGATRTDELRARLSYYMVRREKGDVLEQLPALTHQVLWLEPNAKATAAFKAMFHRKDRHALEVAVKATLKAKRETAIEVAAETRNFLLTTWMKEDAHYMHAKLLELGVDCYLITGDVPHEERQNIIRQAKVTKGGIVCTIDSIGTGTDGIQYVTSNGIMHSVDWVPLKAHQVIGRLHRIGQVNAVHWTLIGLQESVDCIIIENVVQKLDQWKAIMGGKSVKGLRDALADGDGENVADVEAAALKLMYERMTEDQDEDL